MTYYQVWLSNVILYRSGSLERCRRYIERLSRMNPEGVFSVDFNSLSFDDNVVKIEKVRL